MGSVIVCSGFVQGMMTSRLVDRPCGIGFLDLSKFNKFLTCGVDDSRDVIDHGEYMSFDFTMRPPPATMALITPPHLHNLTDSEVDHEVTDATEKAKESKEAKEEDKEVQKETAEVKEESAEDKEESAEEKK